MVDRPLSSGSPPPGGAPSSPDRFPASASETASVPANDSFFRDLVEGVGALLFTLNDQGIVQYINPASVSLLGAGPEEIIGRPLADRWILEDRERAGLLPGEILGGRSGPEYFRVQGPDGSIRWIRLVLRPFFEGGAARGLYGVGHDVTSRRLAEEELAREKKRLESFIHHSTLAVAVLDTESRITAVNRNFEVLFQVRADDVRGRDIDDVVAGPQRTPDMVQYTRRALQGEAVHGVGRRRRTDGSWIEVEFLGIPIMVDGRPSGGYGVYWDASALRQVQEERRAREELLKAFFEQAHDAVLLLEGDRLVDANLRGQDLFGQPRESLLGTTPWLLSPEFQPDGRLSRDVAREHIQAALAGRPQFFGWQHINHEGTPFDTEVALNRLELPGRTLLSALVRDITRRKKAEEALIESERRYRNLFDNISDLIVMHDLDGQLIGVNPAASRLLGFSSAELEGRKIQEFMLPEFRPQFHGRYMEVVMAGGASQGVFVIQDKAEGRHYLEYRATRVDPPNGPPYVTASGRDITERVLAERELRRLEEQLFQAQKMEAIGTLASGISHDFNNILQAMGGYIHLLLTREGMDEASRRHLVEMDEAVDRAAELVHQLLTFSRRLKPDFKVIDLNRLVAQTAAMLRRTIPKMVHVITDLDPDLPVIQGDTGQLSQVLMNLGTNARDAMPDGGRLWIETQGIHYSGASDTPGLDLPPGRYVQMTVADTGHGMDDETVSHIFEPFFTTKDVGEGTGLGLSTVYGIVQSHGGRINCRSRPGEGTRFTILLPARTGTDVLERPCVPTSPLRGGNETILVVDDEYQIREVVREVLSDQGYQVLTAGGGESALRIFRERGHRVDLVLLDLGMPGMGGRECLKRLRQMAPGLRVIVASGYASNGAIDEVLNDGANRFLPKPYRLAQLLSVIRTVIDGEENGNPPIR